MACDDTASFFLVVVTEAQLGKIYGTDLIEIAVAVAE